MRALVMAAALCGGLLPVTAQAGDIQFARDVVPIFKSSCVMCHLPGNSPAGLALHPKGGYANLVGVASTQSPQLRVAPGQPEESYLYRKLVGTHAAASGSGERMPFGDMQLSADQIDVIRRWIADGAKVE